MDIQIFNGDYEIPLRIYFPTEEAMTNGVEKGHTFPVLLFFHGGGWVTESVDTYNRVCARMSQSTGHIVVSVEYRLAPEYRFPTALMDCYAAAKALYTNKLILNTDPRKITIMGDSAGGNLAAAVALMARDNGEFQVYRQILIYPALYNTYTAASPYASVQKNGTDYLLTAVKMQDYLNLYESCPEDRVNPYFAPLLAKDFSNMPETLILTAEFDPLRDEGEDYGKNWQRLVIMWKYTGSKMHFTAFCSWNPLFPCAGKFFLYERILKKGSVKIERRIFELEKTG